MRDNSFYLFQLTRKAKRVANRIRLKHNRGEAIKWEIEALTDLIENVDTSARALVDTAKARESYLAMTEREAEEAEEVARNLQKRLEDFVSKEEIREYDLPVDFDTVDQLRAEGELDED